MPLLVSGWWTICEGPSECSVATWAPASAAWVIWNRSTRRGPSASSRRIVTDVDELADDDDAVLVDVIEAPRTSEVAGLGRKHGLGREDQGAVGLAATTLIFTANQGLLAAKAGASLLSPFVGRLDDINQDGMIVIRELVDIVTIHELDTEVLAASIRNPLHMTQAALAGAHVATLPFKVLQQMVHHPLTDKGIVQFRSDWEKAREALAAKKGD